MFLILAEASTHFKTTKMASYAMFYLSTKFNEKKFNTRMFYSI
jgi:hypothetical protein